MAGPTIILQLVPCVYFETEVVYNKENLKGRKQTKMEGGQSSIYLRLTRVSSGLWVSVAKTYRGETKLK